MFEQLQSLPADPLLGIIARYQQEMNPQKIDLGVGVYKDEAGGMPVLPCIKAAELRLVNEQASKTYRGPLGNPEFSRLMCDLALGALLSAAVSDRLAALQTPGGCGALRVAAELIVRANPSAKIWVSDPTWANHVPLLGDAGIEIAEYPYYDFENKGIRFDAMMACLSEAAPGDLVLLHACCHNPSGADLSESQWQAVAELLIQKELIPFVDMAYQGFGRGLVEDAYGLRLVVSQCPEVIFALSCSKNFGLYRDRVGVVGFVVREPEQAGITLSNLTQIVRGIYSMPPDHGASVVEIVLADEELRSQWLQELADMRERIKITRQSMSAKMSAAGFDERFDFVKHESGMFSFLGITPEQVGELADRFGIYMAPSSRINIAGLNESNLDYFCASLTQVLIP